MKGRNGDKKTDEIVKRIVKTYDVDSGINFIDVRNLPVRDMIF